MVGQVGAENLFRQDGKMVPGRECPKGREVRTKGEGLKLEDRPKLNKMEEKG